MNEGEVLANTKFDFSFAGKTYSIKKASLQQVIEFQRKWREISDQKDPAADLLLIGYAIFLALKAVDSTITEQYVLDNAPGDLELISTLQQLGFMSQQKVKLMMEMRNALASQPSGELSLEQ